MSFVSTAGSILLQSRFDTQYVTEADTSTIIIAVSIIVGFVIFMIIAGVASNRNQRKTAGGTIRYSRGAFRRRARQLGLSKAHLKTLEYVREKYHVKTPMALLANSKQLDFYLGKAITDIGGQVAAEEVKEAQKLSLFRIKQIIERNSSSTAAYTNSKQLKPGQQLTVSSENEVRYGSRIVTLLKDGVAVEVPQNEAGDLVRWKKWAPVSVFFWKSNGEGFSFQSKVTGYNTVKGVKSVIVQHSNKIEASKQRRFRRKSIESPCYFAPIRVMTLGSGRNRQKKAYIDKSKSMLGTIIEISVGGCSIRATRPLPKASLVKVDFEAERNITISSYGKVVNVRKESSRSTTMHIMFTRLSKKNLNLINTYIYEYGAVDA